jgi:hypothetical protein
MGWQPSASKTEILLLCQRPFDPAIEAEPDEPGEPARYGSSFHSVLAACLRSPKKKLLEKNAAGFARAVNKAARDHDVKDTADELAGHVKGSVKVLRNWLAREKLEIAEVEKAYAIKPRPDGVWGVREIKPHDEEHRYKTAPGELPGTVDLIVMNSNHKRTVVLDHKTGYVEDWFANDEFVGFARPTTVGQMRTLGLVGSPLHGEVAIFHADRKGLPIVYSEPYEVEAQQKHVRELHAAFSRIGQGFLRPGPYCKRCPARVGCPARAADLLVESAEVLVKAANAVALEPIDPNALFALPTEPPPAGMLEMRAGALYDMLKRFRELEKAGSAELRRLVRAGAIIETRDGKVLSLRTQTYESLSKKSVLEALGKVAGEKLLTQLRKKGVIREATREMLIGEK